MTIIEQIKAEIENALHILGPGYSEMEMGQISAYGHILSFLSTLESEKPMNQEGLEEDLTNEADKMFFSLGFYEGDHHQPMLDEISLEQFRGIARHFAQLGAEHEKEELMKEAVEGKVFMSFAPGHNQMVMADVDLPTNTKVRIIIVKE